jgi:hypothetical protein
MSAPCPVLRAKVPAPLMVQVEQVIVTVPAPVFITEKIDPAPKK